MGGKAGNKSASFNSRSSCLVDVYVKLPSGRTSVQHLSKSTEVRQIYQNVAAEEHVDVDRVRIKYTGKVLKKNDTIGYLGICRETILKGEIVAIKNINVIIKTEEGKNFMVNLQNVDSVSLLKTHIYNAHGLETSKQRLKFGGRILENSQSLLEAGVTEEACINLEEKEDAAEALRDGATINEEEAPEETKEAVLNSFSSNGRPVEVVFSFDTTGSMYSCLAEVRQKLQDACRRLLRDIPNIRVGLIAHGDYCDQDIYVLRSIDLTNDVDRLTHFADNVPATSGGDCPECYEWVLRKSQQLDWSENSAKALVVIGDCQPHPPSYTDQSINWHDELDVLIGMGVKVYGVQAKNDGNVHHFYRELADRSGGCYINFRHFNLITDMFLAVCYKESSDGQLEAYEEEVKQDGRMTEEMQEIFTQLDTQKNQQKKEEENQETRRYVAEAWWDPALDTGTPLYEYKSDKDKWIPVKKQKTTTPRTPGVFKSSEVVPPLRKKRTKKGCEVM